MQIPYGALDGYRHRVLISTDIGGTDPDDFQSMVHLLLYADVLDIEGLLSSPYGPGRKEDILRVITCYESDYENLIGAKTVSQWREDFLRDFAERMQRCQAPRTPDAISHSTSI